MDQESPSGISAVILAGGSSRRLGTPKQLLALEGKPVLQHTLDLLSTCGFGEIVVVLGHAADEIAAALILPDGGRVVVNPDHAEGQSSSLRCGLAAIRSGASAAAIFLGDQPRIEAEMVTQVLAAFRSSSMPVARPIYRGTPGHPVVLARAAFAAVSGASGDEGARAFLENSNEILTVDIDHDPPPDVDTWADFEALGG